MLPTLQIILVAVTLNAALPTTRKSIYIDLPVNQETATIAADTDVAETALSTAEPEVSRNSTENTADNDANSKNKREDLTPKPVIDSGDRVKVETTIGAGKPSLKFVQKFLSQVLQPKPLVDTIREEEKYGNDGEKFGQIGRSIVGGVAKLTNFISTAVDIPYEALKSLSRKATAALNNIGGKLVGIA